jgi:hypothetical protein
VTDLWRSSEQVERFKRANLQVLLDGLYEKDRDFFWRIHATAPWKASEVSQLPVGQLDASIDLCYRTYHSRHVTPPSPLDAPQERQQAPLDPTLLAGSAVPPGEAGEGL